MEPKQVHTIKSKIENLAAMLVDSPFSPSFITGYVSPHIEVRDVVKELKYAFPDAKFMLCSTSGELCSDNDTLYCDTPETWDNVVLQMMSPEVIQDVEIVSIPLACEDLKQGVVEKDMTQRVAEIRRNIMATRVSLPIDYRDTLAYILFDGLSASESFFLDALYSADRFPCLFVGGSAGGKLDFKDTWIHDGTSLLQGHASIAFLKLAPNVKFGVFKSQNFEDQGPAFRVDKCLAYSFLPIANSIAYFPQVAKLYKSSAEESRSMSLSAWFMWLGGSLISLMYGITNLHDPLFCFVSGVGLAWNVITVALIMWKRRADTFARLSSVTINKSEEQELLGA